MNNKTLNEITKNEKTVKLKDLVSGLESLKVLSDQKLPVFTSFTISLFIKNIAPIIDTYEKERNKLIFELGVPAKDKDGKETGTFTFENKKAEEFNKKINEVLSADLEVKIPQIKIKDLEGVNIEPKHLIALTFMLIE